MIGQGSRTSAMITDFPLSLLGRFHTPVCYQNRGDLWGRDSNPGRWMGVDPWELRIERQDWEEEPWRLPPFLRSFSFKGKWCRGCFKGSHAVQPPPFWVRATCICKEHRVAMHGSFQAAGDRSACIEDIQRVLIMISPPRIGLQRRKHFCAVKLD